MMGFIVSLFLSLVLSTLWLSVWTYKSFSAGTLSGIILLVIFSHHVLCSFFLERLLLGVEPFIFARAMSFCSTSWEVSSALSANTPSGFLISVIFLISKGLFYFCSLNICKCVLVLFYRGSIFSEDIIDSLKKFLSFYLFSAFSDSFPDILLFKINYYSYRNFFQTSCYVCLSVGN